MNQRGSPLWLMRDILCWIGVSITFQTFARAFHKIAMAVEAERRRNLHPGELTLAARLLSEAEAWFAYAIARRAFKLAGLKRSRVRFHEPSPATDQWALNARARQLIQTFDSFDRRARQMARRLIRLHAEPGAATTTPQQQRNTATAPSASGGAVIAVIVMISMIVMTSMIATIPAPRTRAGHRVRAPPWRNRLPIADCRLPRSASFRGRARLRSTTQFIPSCAAGASRTTPASAAHPRPAKQIRLRYVQAPPGTWPPKSGRPKPRRLESSALPQSSFRHGRPPRRPVAAPPVTRP